MSEPRILGPTDRAAIRERIEALQREYGALADDDDLLALLDTCDAMQAVIRRLLDGDRPENGQWLASLCWDDDRGPVSPAEAAVLDTIREDPT